MKVTMKDKKSVKKKSKSSRRFLIIFICVFVSAVLIFGVTLGTILAVRDARAEVKYKNVKMDANVVSFFTSYYKYCFMDALSDRGIAASDTEQFWNEKSESGITYGEMLVAETKNYISAVAVTNYLFNSYSSLSSADKKMISKAVKNTLEYRANGDKKLFNSETEKYGFDYSSFKDAAKMLYKTYTVKDVIYGNDGIKLEKYPELCAEYLSEYTHAKLLFIRTETAYVYDEGGNRVIGNDGNDLTRLLTESEKAERAALIAEIRSYIGAIGSGSVEMGPTMFDYYLKNNDEGDSEMHADGYYFHKNSVFTKEFSEELKPVVDKAYSMNMDSYGEVQLDFGVCFIYKYEPTAGAYRSGAAEMCFADFYSNASNIIFEKTLTDLSDDVVFTKKYSENAVVSKPYNYIYLPVFD